MKWVPPSFVCLNDISPNCVLLFYAPIVCAAFDSENPLQPPMFPSKIASRYHGTGSVNPTVSLVRFPQFMLDPLVTSLFHNTTNPKLWYMTALSPAHT